MHNNVFEKIKKINEYGSEYWLGRELYKILTYSSYRNFLVVVEKAKLACKNSQQDIHNHFVDVNKMVRIGSGAERLVDNIKLSRYACYLIIQNSDPKKKIIALGQTYFAIQTRRQEKSDLIVENLKRAKLREEVKKHNVSLAEAADYAGVSNYGKFQNYGYMGLYGGLNAAEIHKIKKLKKSQKILDHMGSEELAANLFRATQTDAKLRREQILGEASANLTHYQVGKKVRSTIGELGGSMPEVLPVFDDIERVKRKNKKEREKDLLFPEV